MIRIIGLGSCIGDDSAGLAAARRLRGTSLPGVDVVAVERPGVGLLDLLEGTAATILIDAVRSGAAPGTLHDFDLHDLLDQPPCRVSSHAIGVAEALQLAARLGRMPLRGRLLGIEAASDSLRPDAPLSRAAAKGVTAAVARARSWVRRFSSVSSGQLCLKSASRE